MNRFKHQTVLVTGASGGMGTSHAQAYHAEGANVVIAARDDHATNELATHLGPRALPIHLDVTSENDWTTAVQEAEAHFGPITILVNNAGVQKPPAPIEHTELHTWEATFNFNVTGQFLGIRAVAPSMRKAGGGTIVNIASTMAHVGTVRDRHARERGRWAWLRPPSTSPDATGAGRPETRAGTGEARSRGWTARSHRREVGEE